MRDIDRDDLELLTNQIRDALDGDSTSKRLVLKQRLNEVRNRRLHYRAVRFDSDQQRSASESEAEATFRRWAMIEYGLEGDRLAEMRDLPPAPADGEHELTPRMAADRTALIRDEYELEVAAVGYARYFKNDRGVGAGLRRIRQRKLYRLSESYEPQPTPTNVPLQKRGQATRKAEEDQFYRFCRKELHLDRRTANRYLGKADDPRTDHWFSGASDYIEGVDSPRDNPEQSSPVDEDEAIPMRGTFAPVEREIVEVPEPVEGLARIEENMQAIRDQFSDDQGRMPTHIGPDGKPRFKEDER